MQFDSSGNLWVHVTADGLVGTDFIEEFNPGQLAETGNPAPVTSVTTSALCNDIGGCGPWDTTLDAAGNLWMVGYSGPTTDQTIEAVEFTQTQLSAGGSLNLVPALTLEIVTEPYPDPGAVIRFDHAGNLWIGRNESSVFGYGEILEYPAAELNATGVISPTPAISLTSILLDNAYTLGPITGMAFDDVGDLWVANSGAVSELTPDQLLSSGSPTPRAFIYQNRNLTNINLPGLLSLGPMLPK
jgi:hypothetical protein